VTWKRVSGPSPCPREMFSASILSVPSANPALVISGGRTVDSILSDVWILSGTAALSSDQKVSATDSSVDSNEATPPAPAPPSSAPSAPEIVFQWQQMPSYELPHPRCAHTSALLPIPSELPDDPPLYHLILYGGFTGQGISDDLIQCVFSPTTSPSSSISWQPIVPSHTIPGRFGHAMCLPPLWLRPNAKKTNKTSATAAASVAVASPPPRNILLYGGIDAEQDYNDLWLISL
jgi:hypothetical protein